MKKWFYLVTGCIFSILAHASPAPASEVFQVGTKVIDANSLSINWQIKPGYFLYSDRIKLTEPKDSNAQIKIIRFPEAEKKTDRLGKTYPVYRDKLSLPVAVLGTQPGESLIHLFYQGCSDEGFCYPPEKQQIKVSINENLELIAASVEPSSKIEEHTRAEPIVEKSREEAAFDDHLMIMVMSFFGFGLLLAFTPCVLPMIPVLSGIIVGHGKDLTTKKAFFLSLSYVLSMALTYALVGAIVALLGSNLQVIMQSPWSISLFSLVFVLLSLSMFGYYDLKMPNAWQAKLAGLSRSQGKGHYLSAALMGSLSTLILSPCVTAPLIGALSYIAHTGHVMTGSLALFFLGLGMGMPLLMIGTSAGKLLPKAGTWMNAVKSFFGIMLLAVAIYLMGRILPPFIVMILWSLLFVTTGVYSFSSPAKTKFKQVIGIILLVYGLLILIGASMGSHDPVRPLEHLGKSNQIAPLAMQKVKKVHSVKDVEQVLGQSKGKPVMIDFYADWCSSCKVMEETTFKDPALLQVLNDFIILKADVTENSRQDKALLDYFKVIAPPTFLFIDKEGDKTKALRVVGEVEAETLIQKIKQFYSLNTPLIGEEKSSLQ